MIARPHARSLALAAFVAVHTGACSLVTSFDGFTSDAGEKGTSVSGTGGASNATATSSMGGATSSESGALASGPIASTGSGCDTMHDPSNCGACGHDCLGGACASGVCQPVVLAGPLFFPIALVLDPTTAYFTVVQGIYEAPKSGGPATLLANQAAGPLAVDATNVYTVLDGDPGDVYSIAKIGGASTMLGASTTGYQPVGIAVRGSNVYWNDWETANGLASHVTSVPTVGGTQSILVTANGTATTPVVVDDEYLYWVDENGVERAPIQGGSETTIVPGSWGDGDLTLDSTNLYWADASGHVYQTKKDGSSGAIELGASTEPIGVAVDATTVYWCDESEGIVYATPIGGGAVRTLATSQDTPTAIAVDDVAVYWVDGGSFMSATGALMRVAK